MLTVGREEFQASHPYRRWISNAHRINPDSGRAIINVGEGDAPENSKRVRFVYTWREWDLRANEDVQVLQICENPREPFKPEPFSS